jgi:DNA polymerase-3 subunit epsilon
MFLTFDTETTGKPLRGIPPWAAGQPFIVQLCAELSKDDGTPVSSFNCLIKPEGWKISDEAFGVHGISQDACEKVGVPIKTALSMLRWMMRPAFRYVAHSAEFDLDRIEAEIHRQNIVWDLDRRPAFCTKIGMMDVCKLPHTNGRKWAGQEFKWPSLQEAHTHCFGAEFAGAHGAIADVQACKRVFLWMRENKLVKNDLTE